MGHATHKQGLVLQPCAVDGCGVPSLPCFGTWLCAAHGTEANIARDRAGLAYEPWKGVVEWVGGWLEGKRAISQARGLG